MKVRCASCQKRFSAPFKKQVRKCSQCGRHVLVNPDRPFSKIWFLFLIAMPFVVGYSDVSSSGWSGDTLFGVAFVAAIPTTIYFCMMYFSGTELISQPQSAPTLEPVAASAKPVEIDLQVEKPKRPAATVVSIVVFFAAFLAWVYFYLFHLRPIMNRWLAQYIGGYPAMLHIVPLVACNN